MVIGSKHIIAFYMNEQNYSLTKISCFTGYIVQAVIVNLAPIFFIIFQNDYNVSYSALANLIFMMFLAQLIIDALSIKLSDIFSLRAITMTANIMAALGLIGLSVLPRVMDAYTGIMLSTLVSSIGAGFIEVIISPIIDAIPHSSSKASMSLLHSFYCWGQMLTVLVSSLVLMAIGNDAWSYIPLAWAVIPTINIFLFAFAPLPEMVTASERTPLKTLFGSRNFIILMLLMLCSGATELSVSQWASLFAEKGLGVSKTIGDLLGPCLFAVFMGTGRVIFGLCGNRLNYKKALSLCATGALICYFTMIFVPVPLIGLFGCAMTGFCVSLMWPGTLSLTSSLFPLGGMSIFSIAAICGDLGAAFGPWIAGQVSDAVQSSATFASISDSVGITIDQIGLRVGLLVCAVFPLAMIIAVNMIKHDDKTINKEKI